MSVVVLLELPAADGQVAALEAFLREMLPVTRLADGCESLTLTRSQGQATTMTVIQVWQSREQYLTYSRWRQKRGDLEPFHHLLRARPRLGFHDLLDTY